jgi:hypothetical protein
MSFANETRFAALPVPLLDREGNDVLVVIVKATFVVDAEGEARLADPQHDIRVSDVPRNPDDPASSLLFPSDLCVEKRGTDVVVVGDAVSPKPVTVMDVGVQLREVVPLRVHGTRVFYQGPLGASIGPAQPFTRMPVAYELAYGGMTDDLGTVEMKNPSGVGVAKRGGDLVGKRAPQIEHPARPHKTASDQHPPMGFGPIMTHWSPRRELGGTFDQAWQAERMPLLPRDYDTRYANVAHPSLQLDPHLSPGEPIGVVGMSLEPLATKVPALPIEVRARYDGGDRAVYTPPIDTVIIVPEKRTLEIVARAALLIGRGQRVLRDVVVRNHG